MKFVNQTVDRKEMYRMTRRVWETARRMATKCIVELTKDWTETSVRMKGNENLRNK